MITRQKSHTPTRRSTPSLELLGVALIALAASAAPGCSSCRGGEVVCDPACPDGFTCQEDTRTCSAAELPPYTQAVTPGRGARVELVDGEPFFASIDPSRGYVVLDSGAVGQAPKILATNVREGSSRLELVARGGKVRVVWIGEDGRFNIATRVTGDAGAEWATEVVSLMDVGEQELGYRVGDHFSVGVDSGGVVHIAFFDRDERALFLLSPSTTQTGRWASRLIDDGAGVLSSVCPEQIRQARNLGVGLDPELLIEQDIFYVAYYDADCGDLRLARSNDASRWVLRALERGDDSDPTRYLTGRYPSIALDGAGRPAVAFHDVTGAQLLYGVLRDEQFFAQVVDEGVGSVLTEQKPKRVVGAFAELSFDASDRPVITYFDGSEANLMRARGVAGQDALSWSRKELVRDGLVGFFAHHVLVNAELWAVSERLTPGAGGVRTELVLVKEEL